MMQDESAETVIQPEKKVQNNEISVLRWFCEWSLIIYFICSVLLCFVGFGAPLQILFYLIAGWIWFLFYSFSRISPDYSTMLIGIIALILFTVSLKYLIRSLLQKYGDDQSVKWSLRSSFLATLLICVGFVAGTAMIGVTHQATWLIIAKEPILKNSSRTAMYSSSSKLNLKQIGFAFHGYYDQYNSFPLGQTSNSTGRPLHGWLTNLLIFVEQEELYEQIDLNVSWDDEKNRKAFEQALSVYNNPAIRKKEKLIDSATGLPVAHYAGNVRVIQRNYGVKFLEITDGTSNTILSGEVNSQFQPWGKPSHLRDPALGINKHPYGFGSPYRYNGEGSALFVMVDGSIRNIADVIDPKILKALSTPDGGEDIHHEDF